MAREAVQTQFLDSRSTVAQASANGELKQAMKKLEQLVLSGLRHGHFEIVVECDVMNNKKRRLLIKSGVSHQFIIPLEAIEDLD
jgi:hypothetical protein